MSDQENPVSVYILTHGTKSTRAMTTVLDALLGGQAHYTIGANSEEALSGKYHRVIDCTSTLDDHEDIEVVRTGVSLVDILRALK